MPRCITWILLKSINHYNITIMSEKINSVYSGSTEKDRQFLQKMKEIEQEFELKVEQGLMYKEIIPIANGYRVKYHKVKQS